MAEIGRNGMRGKLVALYGVARRLAAKICVGFKHPISCGSDLIQDIHNDYLALTGKVAYKHHLILVIGLPNSGTTWVEQLISEVPGYVSLPDSLLRNLWGPELLLHPHGINNLMLSSAPLGRYSYLKLHTHYDQRYVQLLDNFGIRPILLIRDLRDMMISRYYHSMADHTDWMHNRIKDLDFEEGFTRSLFATNLAMAGTALNFYTDWVIGWLDYIKANPSKLLLIRYEEMRNNSVQTLSKILKFCEISFDSITVEQIIERQVKKYRPKESLTDNLNQPGRRRSTFRSGQVGGWKNCFNDEHREIFKGKAREALILSGYERRLESGKRKEVMPMGNKGGGGCGI